MKTAPLMCTSILAAILSFTAVGCGGSKNDVAGTKGETEFNGKSERVCDQNYVDSRNQIAYAGREIKTQLDSSGRPDIRTQAELDRFLASMKKFDSSCDAFLSQYGSVNCVLASQETFQAELSDGAKLQDACSQMKQIYQKTQNALKQQSNSSTVATAAIDAETLEAGLATTLPDDSNVELIENESDAVSDLQ